MLPGSARLDSQPYDRHLAVHPHSSAQLPQDAWALRSFDRLSPSPLLLLRYRCCHLVSPAPRYKPFAPPLGSHFQALLLRRFLLVGPYSDTFLLVMVIADGPEPSPVRAAVVSVVRKNSPPATASANVAAKPPFPPATKTMSSPTGGPAAAISQSPVATSHPAAVVAPPAPVRQEPMHVAPSAAVAPPVAPVLAAPIVAAASAALGGDLVLAAVSATTGGPAPAVVPAKAVQLAPVAPPLVPSGQLYHHDPIRPSGEMTGSRRVIDMSLLSAAHRAGTGKRDGVGEGAGGEVTDVDVAGRLMRRGLYSNYLTGTMPIPSTSLVALDVGFNYLSGTFPKLSLAVCAADQNCFLISSYCRTYSSMQRPTSACSICGTMDGQGELCSGDLCSANSSLPVSKGIVNTPSVPPV
ncbi:unnamed protein product [Closterium sp. Naga37s-1]|nr:unnamed protein product [Closterium sp. Naga37s-1]